MWLGLTVTRLNNCIIKGQRMHLSPYDLPLQSSPRLNLASYISTIQDSAEDHPLYDLPQPLSSATSHNRRQQQNSKQLMPTLPTEEEHFPQATFKPTQLQQILSNQNRESKMEKYKTPIQQMLQDQLFGAPSHQRCKTQQSQAVGKENKREAENRPIVTRKPTKYQVLLDQFYNKNPRTQRSTPKTTTNRASSTRIPPQPIMTSKTFQNQTRRLQTCKSERAVSWQQAQREPKKPQNQSNMPHRKHSQRSQSLHPLQKTSSQPQFKPGLAPTSTLMSFQQRQNNTIERRKAKQYIGQGQQQQRQIDQCTFIPHTNPSHRQSTLPVPSKNVSYAQMYKQKIRARR